MFDGRGRWIVASVMFAGAVVAIWWFMGNGSDGAEAQRTEQVGGRRIGGVTAAPDRRASPRTTEPPILPPSAAHVPEFDPKDPKYDPTKLALSVGDPSLPWKLEQRNAEWASKRELALRNLLEEHLKNVRGHGKVSDLECRQLSCRLSVEIDKGNANEILSAYPIMLLSPFTSISGESDRVGNGKESAVFYLSYTYAQYSALQFDSFLKPLLQQYQPQPGGTK
jgi:hypothetical protein